MRVWVAAFGVGVEGDVGLGVGSWPLEAAREATACRSADAILSVFATGGATGPGVGPAAGLRYMPSIVGRNAAPNGVAKKSVGRSGPVFSLLAAHVSKMAYL